jgi:MinD-like ATPase involved in chromosome partitioning or flagellar assembly
MAQIITIHSFRGGTGKTTIIASLAVLMANQGYRVGLIDVDVLSPWLHVLFGLTTEKPNYTLNDYLWDRCSIEQTVYDVSAAFTNQTGSLHVIPCSGLSDSIRIIKEGCDVTKLNDGVQRLVEFLNLDVLLMDTHFSFNEFTLFLTAISTSSIVVMRADNQDIQGTAVLIELAKKLDIPEPLLMVNMCPSAFETAVVQANLEAVFKCKVPLILPFSTEIQALSSGSVFAHQYPTHPITQALEHFASGKGVFS